MSDKLVDKSCLAFGAALASDAPVPGGGGAAALAGALAAALAVMAGRLTAAKPAFAPQAEELHALVSQADALRLALLALVDADAEGFFPLSKAYALSKDTPGRREILRRATLDACAAPLQMAEQLGACTELLEKLLTSCSRLLLSDVGCGAALCAGALEAAAMNVFVNTRALPEDGEAKTLARKAGYLLDEYLPRARAVSAEVLTQLQKAENHG